MTQTMIIYTTNHITCPCPCIIFLMVPAQLKMTSTFPCYGVITLQFLDRFLYWSLLSHLILTNVCFLLESESNLSIVMSSPNLTAYMRTHSSICAREVNSFLLVNCFQTSTWITTSWDNFLSPSLDVLALITTARSMISASGCIITTTNKN